MSPAKEKIEYIRASAEYHDSIVDFSYNDYFVREALSVSFDWKPELQTNDSEYKEQLRSQLKQGLSYVAINTSNGKLVGICVNVLSTPEVQDEDATRMVSSTYYPILKFLSDLEAGYDIFKLHGVEKVFELMFLGVLESYGNRGIAAELSKHSEELARENGFRVIKTTATSPVTAHIFKKLQYTLIKEQQVYGFPGLPKAKLEDHCQFLVKVL